MASDFNFIIDRSLDGGVNWTLGYATLAPVAGSGTNVSFLDTAVVLNTTYTYRVSAVNGLWVSAFSNLATAIIAVPGAPANVAVTSVRNGANDLTTLTWTPGAPLSQASFTIQRATNSTFTTGLQTTTVAAASVSFSQNTPRGVTYFYRIRANNVLGSSAWTDAVPFPILTP